MTIEIKRLFLIKVNRFREKLKQVMGGGLVPTSSIPEPEKPPQAAQSNVKEADVFLTQLQALSCPRNMKTRRLAQAEDNPEMTKTARLACIFKDLYSEVVSAKGSLWNCNDRYYLMFLEPI